jgi:hypothetical protein
MVDPVSRSLHTAAAGSDPTAGQSLFAVHVIDANPSHVPEFAMGGHVTATSAVVHAGVWVTSPLQ